MLVFNPCISSVPHFCCWWLKTAEFILSPFRRPKAELNSHWRHSPQPPVPLVSGSQQPLGFLGLLLHYADLCLHLDRAFFLVCVYVTASSRLIKSAVTERRVYPSPEPQKETKTHLKRLCAQAKSYLWILRVGTLKYLLMGMPSCTMIIQWAVLPLSPLTVEKPDCLES